MDDIQVLLAQRAELDKKISDARREKRADVIASIRNMMAEHGLSAADIAGKTPTVRAASTGTNKVAAKYRNGATGDTWSGRGLQPRWLRAALEGGAKIADFKI